MNKYINYLNENHESLRALDTTDSYGQVYDYLKNQWMYKEASVREIERCEDRYYNVIASLVKKDIYPEPEEAWEDFIIRLTEESLINSLNKGE